MPIAGPIIGAVASSVIGGMMSDDSGAQQASDSSAAANKLMAEIAGDQWAKYKEMYMPLEKDFIEQSKGLDSFANQNKGAQQAAADVAGSFAAAREKLNDVPGANPSSQAYLNEQNKLNLAEAASSAAAQTGARETVRDKGHAAMVDALSLGKGLPAAAVSGLGSAASGMASASRYAQQRADASAGAFGKVIGGITSSSGFQKWMSDGFGGGGYTPGGSVASNAPDDIDIGGGWNPAFG